MNMTYFGALNSDSMKSFGINKGEYYEFLIKKRDCAESIKIKTDNISKELKKLYLNDFFGLIYNLNKSVIS